MTREKIAKILEVNPEEIREIRVERGHLVHVSRSGKWRVYPEQSLYLVDLGFEWYALDTDGNVLAVDDNKDKFIIHSDPVSAIVELISEIHYNDPEGIEKTLDSLINYIDVDLYDQVVEKVEHFFDLD